MADATDVESFRKRGAHLKEVDLARTDFLDDMLRKLDDMQKTMDRNAFVMVLIDGDCMNFLNDLVERGVTGGEEAAKLIRRAVFDYLRHDEHFKHDHKIVIRVYANLRGLAKTYVEKGVLANTVTFFDFVLGFNKAHALCDFIDAGNHKEAADTKLKENICLSLYNVHCKQIIFGASADNGYASFLSSSFVDIDISTRLRLLKGPPFSSEFKTILPRFTWTEFKHIFRSEFITNEPRAQDILPRETMPDSVVMKEISGPAPAFITGNKKLLYPSELDTMCEGDAEKALENSIKLHNLTRYGTSHPPKAASEEGEGSSVSSIPPSSPHSEKLSQCGKTPTEADITSALIDSTDERLRYSPTALDFGTVRQMVELRLGLSPGIWESFDLRTHFPQSKNVIKYAVENWVERTNKPPPKNATWMLSYFNGIDAPSSVMKSPLSKTWRAKLNTKQACSNALVANTRHSTPVCWNSAGQRIDIPVSADVGDKIKISQKLRECQPPLCNAHHINRSCPNLPCPRDHRFQLTKLQYDALVYYARSQRCPQGPSCREFMCVKGHMCPHGKECVHGSRCWFVELHGMDTQIAGYT